MRLNESPEYNEIGTSTLIKYIIYATALAVAMLFGDKIAQEQPEITRPSEMTTGY